MIAANFAKLPERTAVENLTIEQDVVGELHQSARRCQEALPAADNGDWLTYRMIRSRIEGTE